MLQLIDKKNKIFFYIFILIILSTINNQTLFKKINIILGVKEIVVKGLNEKENNIVKSQVNFLINQNIFFINKASIKSKINQNDFIEKIVVKKIYPSKIYIETKPAELLAITTKDNKKYYIGSNGKLIKKNHMNFNENLPIIFGNFLIKDYLLLSEIFLDEGFNLKDFKKVYYFQNKRWDVEIQEGLVVKLPRKNIKQAVNKMKLVLENDQFSINKTIDLRIPNQIIIN